MVWGGMDSQRWTVTMKRDSMDTIITEKRKGAMLVDCSLWLQNGNFYQQMRGCELLSSFHNSLLLTCYVQALSKVFKELVF